MISQTDLYPPQPATTRGSATFISYDPINNRVAYTAGKSVFVRSLDPDSSTRPVQFTKHTFPATVAVFSPSGNYIASGDEAGNVKIWDSSLLGKETPFEQPNIKSEFQVLSGAVKSLAWDADGQRVIAVGQGKEKFGHCFTWDSGNSIGEIQGHSETINAVDIKPQRPYRAATVGDDKAMVFFTGPPFKFDKSLRNHHTNAVRAVKFSPDGKYVVSAGSDKRIVLYDGKTGEFIAKLDNAHDGGIFGIAWLPDSLAFVTSSADNTVKEWNAPDLTEKAKYVVASPATVDNQQVGVAVAKDSVVSLSLNGALNIFKFSSSSPDQILHGHQRAVTTLALAGDSVVSGGSDGGLFLWKVETSKISPEAEVFGSADEKHTNYVASVTAYGDGVLTTGWDDKLKLWEGEKVQHTVQLSGQPKGVAVLEKSVVVLMEDNIEVYDLSLKQTASGPLNFAASSISAIPGGSTVLVTNESDKRVEEFKIGSAVEHVRSYPTLRAAPTLVKVSPDGQYAAVAENTGKYTLYNTKDASAITTRWAFHSSRVNDAEWTSDSKFLVSGGLDCSILVYSVDRPAKVLKAQLTHQTGVSALAWLNYDGTKGSFVSAGLDGAIKSWDADFSVYVK